MKTAYNSDDGNDGKVLPVQHRQLAEPLLLAEFLLVTERGPALFARLRVVQPRRSFGQFHHRFATGCSVRQSEMSGQFQAREWGFWYLLEQIGQ